MRQFAQRAVARGVHQDGEDILVGDGGGFEPADPMLGLGFVAGLEVAQALDLALLDIVRRPSEFNVTGDLHPARRITERVDPDERQLARMFLVLIIDRLVLDLAALIARLHGAKLHGCKLRETNLAGADLSDVDLTDADLGGADLTEANLRDAKFYRVVLTPNLMYANLSMSQLQEARLGGATLERADLQGAHIKEAQLAEAGSISGAVMPDGSKRE